MRETPVSENTPVPDTDTPVSESRKSTSEAAQGGSESQDNSPRQEGGEGGDAGESAGQRMSRRERFRKRFKDKDKDRDRGPRSNNNNDGIPADQGDGEGAGNGGNGERDYAPPQLRANYTIPTDAPTSLTALKRLSPAALIDLAERMGIQEGVARARRQDVNHHVPG